MSLEANSICHLEIAPGADCSSAPLSQAIFHQKHTASVLHDLYSPSVYFRLACEVVAFFSTCKAVIALVSSSVIGAFLPHHTKAALDFSRRRYAEA